MLERPHEAVQIEPLRLRIPGVTAVHRNRKLRRSRPAAVDRARIVFHPLPISGQPVERPAVDVTARSRAHVHEQIAAARNMVDQHLDAHARTLPAHFVPEISPRAREGLTPLPDHRIPLRVDHAFVGRVLFRRLDVAGAGQVEPVVDDDSGLKPVDECVQLLRLPVVAPLAVLAGVGEVEPDDVHLAVVRQKFRHLVAHVLRIPLHIPCRIEFRDLLRRKIPQRVNPVDREIRMMPVEQRIVESHFQPLPPECVDNLAQKVTTDGRVRHLVIGVFRIPEAEPLVVFGRDDEIFHPRLARSLRPRFRIEQIGIEHLEVDLVSLIRNPFGMAHPLMPRRKRIESPVNEHPEPVMHEPSRIAFSHFSISFAFEKNRAVDYIVRDFMSFYNILSMNKVK